MPVWGNALQRTIHWGSVETRVVDCDAPGATIESLLPGLADFPHKLQRVATSSHQPKHFSWKALVPIGHHRFLHSLSLVHIGRWKTDLLLVNPQVKGPISGTSATSLSINEMGFPFYKSAIGTFGKVLEDILESFQLTISLSGVPWRKNSHSVGNMERASSGAVFLHWSKMVLTIGAAIGSILKGCPSPSSASSTRNKEHTEEKQERTQLQYTCKIAKSFP